MGAIRRRRQTPTSIRLPAHIQDLIDASAMENQRSRNLEIVLRLAQSLGLKEFYGSKRYRKTPQE